MLASVEDSAFASYQTDFKEKVMGLTKKNSLIKICRTSIQDYKEVELQQHKDDGKYHILSRPVSYCDVLIVAVDIVGLGALTEAVADTLQTQKGDGLRIIWIASQRNRADLKLKGNRLLLARLACRTNQVAASLTGCIDQYWRVQKVSKIPIVPIVCMWTLGSAYMEIIAKLNHIWGLKTDPPGLLTMGGDGINVFYGFLSDMFDASEKTIFWNTAALATYNLGPLAGSLVAKITLKIIIGLALIYERLFLLQQRTGDSIEPLTEEQIQKEAQEFRSSDGRKRMSDTIEKGITIGNCYKQDAVESTARDALRAGKSKFGDKYSRSKNEWAVWNALQ